MLPQFEDNLKRFFVFLLAIASVFGKNTALDDYIKTSDTHYAFQFVKKLLCDEVAVSLVEMTSQAWTPSSEMGQNVWKHWVVIYQPKKVKYSTALLFISGGNNDGKMPESINANYSNIARETGSVVVELCMVPNQPFTFKKDEFGPRVEDQLIAYNWRKFLDGGEASWLTKLPMAKSVVRAMDTVTSFLGSKKGGKLKVDRFVLAGESKRAWTAWMTAAVDQRVVGIAPTAIDLLNLKPSFIHHYRAYGFWAPAVQDYFREGILDRIDEPRFEELLAIVDPYSYRERYTMPKLLLNATGDQFFLPDSSQFYFADLPGEKYLRYVPNSDHYLMRKTDAMESLIAFYYSLVTDQARPEFSWHETEEGLRIETADKPSSVKLWKATNPNERDFRLDKVGPVYLSTILEPEEEGTYVVKVPEPEKGWTAYFVEMTYPSGHKKFPFKFTTPVWVIPKHYPFSKPVCGQTEVGRRTRVDQGEIVMGLDKKK